MRKLMLTVVAATMLLAGCGSDNNTASTASTASSPTAKVACATGTLSGAGATFPQAIVQQWIKDYQAACPGATVNYQAVGSGAGIQQFTAGTVDFGASDAAMKPDEEQAATAKGGQVLHIPWTAGGIAVFFNVSGLRGLKLSPDAVAGIFAGTIKKWNDPKIAADNSGTTLPDIAVQVVHRSDGSGTTNVFTSYLTAVAPAVWTAGAAKDVKWPAGQGAKGSDGVTATVKQTEGAVGYAELSYAKGAGLPVAKIKNPSGAYVEPTPAAVSAALAKIDVPTDLKIKADFTPDDAAAYPISTPTWALVFAKPADGAKATLVRSFLTYVLGAGQKAAPGLDYAPLPASVLDPATAAVKGIAA
ncbi:MAG: phosphate ABC transporter substrate-binding protein PstS [Actinobacteria bacterium]|nr:phosphate ABC transporter substrate-binding protein PstS [Actinomycetota bacterium]